MSTLPIIRLEVQQMKHCIITALSEYSFKIDEQVKEAVEQYCQPENISKVIHEQAWHTIDAVVKELVDQFFRWGDGRKVVKEMVLKKLSEELKYMDGEDNA